MVDSKDWEQVRTIVNYFGFDSTGVKASDTEVYRDSLTGLLLEMKSWDAFARHTQANKDVFMPLKANAALEGQRFRTMTVEGHEIYSDIQQKRSVDENWGEGEHKYAQHFRTLVNKIKSHGDHE